MKHLHPKLYFFAPKENKPGGYQILFAKLIKKILEKGSFAITLIDNKDGYIKEFLSGIKFNFIPFSDKETIKLDNNSILFTNLVMIGEIDRYIDFSPGTKLFFWELGPYSLIQRNMILGNKYKTQTLKNAKFLSKIFEKKRKQRMKTFLKQATDNYGLFFMCYKNYYFNSYFFNLEIEPNYLPIPVYTENFTDRNNIDSLKNKKLIRIAWLSRLVSRKIVPLQKLMSEIANYKNKYNFELIIIGQGSEETKLKKLAELLDIHAIFPGRIEHKELDKFLLNNVDIGFGMGTSALEFGKLGIPTILTTGENTLKNDAEIKNNYTWLFDSVNYNLSSEPCLTDKTNLKSFEEVIFELIENHEYVSKKCYDYVLENHDFDLIFQKIIRAINQNSFTYKQYKDIKIFDNCLLDTILINFLHLKKKIKRSI